MRSFCRNVDKIAQIVSQAYDSPLLYYEQYA